MLSSLDAVHPPLANPRMYNVPSIVGQMKNVLSLPVALTLAFVTWLSLGWFFLSATYLTSVAAGH